jgi:hypothetical protein
MSKIVSEFTRAKRAAINAERIAQNGLQVPNELFGQQISRFVSQSLSKKPTGERIELLLRHAERFKIELMDARTVSAYTNATISTARSLYREVIKLIRGELETIPHTQTEVLNRQLSTAQQGLSALESSSSQGMYIALSPKKSTLNYHA